MTRRGWVWGYILSPPERDLLRHFVPRKLSNVRMPWKSEKMMKADMRGLARGEI
jgi:hypothetical protein